ncbi:MAG: caspase family protein [Chloroflexota bacterium]|nr:caspase family protein [Chloroflexota bacterium]
MNWTSSLRFWLVLTMVGAFSASAGFASELPPIIPAEDIVQQLSPAAPLPSGRKRKIEFEPAGEESVTTQPTPAPAAVSQRIALPAIEFEFDSDRLTPRARQQVSELAKALTLDALRALSFAVQGHTDSVGDRDYNRSLSLRRASAVKRHLVAENIAAHRLVEIGLGEDYPLPGLAGDDGRNRRVEIVHLGTANEVDVPPVARDTARKALLIGIDAYQNVSPLIGPVNDAKAMHAFITADLGFDVGDVKLLADADATRANILREIEEWLIGGTRPGDEVFFYFSGHGFQQPDTSGDESDRFDETLVPVDVVVRNGERVVGMISDDEIAALLNRLSGRSVTVVVDACHSGTSDRISVVGDAWRYVKSPRRPDGGPLRLGEVDPSRTVEASAPEAFLSTKDPQLRAADVTVWAAVEAHQKALVDEEVRGAPLSVFTRRFLTGLRDAEADTDANGVVTRSELHAYLVRESEAYCARHANRCRRGLTPQLHAALHTMDAPAFGLAPAAVSAQARAVKDILVGPASGAEGDPGGEVELRIQQGTRLEVGTELEIVVTSPRDGHLVLLDIDAAGDMVQVFPNRFSSASGVPTSMRAGEAKRVPDLALEPSFRLRVSPPAGAGTLVAVVSDEVPQLDVLTSQHKDLSVIERPKAYLVELAEVLRAGGDPPDRRVATLDYETVMPVQ